MSYEAEFDAFLPDTVTYEPYVSEDLHGAKTYGAAKSVKARVEQLARLVRDQSGREVVSNTRLLMKPVATDGTAFTPTVKDRITLPTGYTPQAPPPIGIMRVNDDAGLHHYEAHL